MNGDVFRLRTARHYGAKSMGDRMIWEDIGPAKKTDVLVVMLVGVEPKEPKTEAEFLDVEKALNELGWMKNPEMWKDEPTEAPPDDPAVEWRGGMAAMSGL